LRGFDLRVVVFSLTTTLAAGCSSDDGAPSIDARPARVERADDDSAARIRARRQAGERFGRELRQVDPDLKVTTLGKGHTILRLSAPNCDTEKLAAFAREAAQRLRDLGFERLECLGRFERAEMPL